MLSFIHKAAFLYTFATAVKETCQGNFPNQPNSNSCETQWFLPQSCQSLNLKKGSPNEKTQILLFGEKHNDAQCHERIELCIKDLAPLLKAPREKTAFLVEGTHYEKHMLCNSTLSRNRNFVTHTSDDCRGWDTPKRSQDSLLSQKKTGLQNMIELFDQIPEFIQHDTAQFKAVLETDFTDSLKNDLKEATKKHNAAFRKIKKIKPGLLLENFYSKFSSNINSINTIMKYTKKLIEMIDRGVSFFDLKKFIEKEIALITKQLDPKLETQNGVKENFDDPGISLFESIQKLRDEGKDLVVAITGVAHVAKHALFKEQKAENLWKAEPAAEKLYRDLDEYSGSDSYAVFSCL